MAGSSAFFDQKTARQNLASVESSVSRVPAGLSGGQSNSAGLISQGPSSGLGNAQLATLQASVMPSPSATGAIQPIVARDRITPEEALARARSILKQRTAGGLEGVRDFEKMRGAYWTGVISDRLGSITHNVTPTTLGEYDHVDALVEEATDAGRRLQWPTCGRLLSEATTELERLERQMAEAREGAEAGAELAVDALHMVQGLAVVLVAVPIGTAAGVAVAGEAAATAGLFSTAGLATASTTAGVTAGYGMVFESAGQLATRGAIDPAAVAKLGVTQFFGTFFGHYINGVLTKCLGDWLRRYVSRELLASGLPARALSEGEGFAVELLSGALATPFTTALGVVTARFVNDSPWPTPGQFVEQVMLEIPKGVLMSVLMQAALRPAMAASNSPPPVGAVPVSNPATVARTRETTATSEVRPSVAPLGTSIKSHVREASAAVSPKLETSIKYEAQTAAVTEVPKSPATTPAAEAVPAKTKQPIEITLAEVPGKEALGVSVNKAIEFNAPQTVGKAGGDEAADIVQTAHEPTTNVETRRIKGIQKRPGPGADVAPGTLKNLELTAARKVGDPTRGSVELEEREAAAQAGGKPSGYRFSPDTLGPVYKGRLIDTGGELSVQAGHMVPKSTGTPGGLAIELTTLNQGAETKLITKQALEIQGAIVERETAQKLLDGGKFPNLTQEMIDNAPAHAGWIHPSGMSEAQAQSQFMRDQLKVLSAPKHPLHQLTESYEEIAGHLPDRWMVP